MAVVYGLSAFILTSLWRLDVGIIEYLLLLSGFFFTLGIRKEGFRG